MEASDGSEERAPARPLSHMQAGRRGESQQDALYARHDALHARAKERLGKDVLAVQCLKTL